MYERFALECIFAATRGRGINDDDNDDDGARTRHCHDAEFRLSRLKSKESPERESRTPDGIEFTSKNSPLGIPLSPFNVDLRFQLDSFRSGRIGKPRRVYSVQKVGESNDTNFYSSTL